MGDMQTKPYDEYASLPQAPSLVRNADTGPGRAATLPENISSTQAIDKMPGAQVSRHLSSVNWRSTLAEHRVLRPNCTPVFLCTDLLHRPSRNAVLLQEEKDVVLGDPALLGDIARRTFIGQVFTFKPAPVVKGLSTGDSVPASGARLDAIADEPFVDSLGIALD